MVGLGLRGTSLAFASTNFSRQPANKKVPNLRPTLSDKVMLWFSSGIDGYQSVLSFRATQCRVEDMLYLIKVHDRRRYNRIAKDLQRIWVRLVPGGLARYRPLRSHRRCRTSCRRRVGAPCASRATR
jgi:hypothetical protein